MKRWLVLVASSLLVLASCSRSTTVDKDVVVDPPLASVPLGKTVQFRNRGAATGATWSVVATPGHGIVSANGLYQAPFFLPSTQTAVIEARAGARTSRATVTLLDAVTDSTDCVGAPDTGYVYVEELPEAISRIAPQYPEAARVAGVQGTVIVQARVCRCGLIDRTRIVQSVPLLDEASVSAIRQWVFKPALTNNQPVAVWVAIPVRYTLNSPEVVTGTPELASILLP